MLWTLFGCAHAPPPAAVPSPAPPPLAAPLALDEPGLAALLANAGDAPLVVNFWATWCGPCVSELPELAAVAGEHPEVDFALIAVDERGQGARVTEFLTTRDIRLPAWHLTVDDPSATLARTVPRWPDLIPVTLILEPGGEVRRRFDGTFDGAALREALR
ncbi:MAG: TlpA family protein disulfide reductase [Myxococcota bacterium]